MVLCESCGSIQVVVAQRLPFDALLDRVSSKRRFICRRCGWHARKGWTDDELKQLSGYGFGGGESDPGLGVLDEVRHEPRRRRRKRSRRRKTEFDLGDLLGSEVPPAELRDGITLESAASRKRSPRIRSRRRREIYATIVTTALVLFIIALLTLSGSCSLNTSEDSFISSVFRKPHTHVI
jgi:hypothetical protein